MSSMSKLYEIYSLSNVVASVLATGWVSQLASPIYTDVDHALNLQKVFGKDAGRKIQVAVHRGQVWVSSNLSDGKRCH